MKLQSSKKNTSTETGVYHISAFYPDYDIANRYTNSLDKRCPRGQQTRPSNLFTMFLLIYFYSNLPAAVGRFKQHGSRIMSCFGKDVILVLGI